MTEGPFTDDMIRHYLTSVQTQAGIQKYAEAMAQVIAEAARASNKVTRDAPSYAVERWIEVIRKRALDILREDEPKTQDERKARLMARIAKQ